MSPNERVSASLSDFSPASIACERPSMSLGTPLALSGKGNWKITSVHVLGRDQPFDVGEPPLQAHKQ